jgi:hypothetical protein
MEDVLAQPRRWDCLDGSLCRSDAFLSAYLWLLILNHGRRQILWLGVTAHPTAEWIARQLTEACGWERTPEYLVRDRDSVYGEIFTRRLRAMGIRDRPIAPRSPWQNGHARPNGSIPFAALLRHMVEHDGLTDDKVPMNQRCGRGSVVVGRLMGHLKPSLAEIRNSMAHGDPFDSLPWAGLLELVRDLIDYSYRDWPTTTPPGGIRRTLW